jgi:CRP/FNR family transcriptional regulator, cyclic AMP receptor protein
MRKALLFLGILDDGDLSWIISEGGKQAIAAGTTLIEEGRPIDALYLVLDGALTVSTAATGSKVLARLMCGEVVGEMSFVDSRPPSASVRAAEPSVVLSVPKGILARRLETDAAFAARFYRALAVFLSDRLRGTVGLLGYSGEHALDDREYADEIDPDTLDKISLAGARFDLLQRKLRSN